jgi:xylulose-5-phosphate/fructose-6-phosphate phosphoketolase
LRSKAAHLVEQFEQQLTAHHHYVREQLEDLPSIRDWSWVDPSA